MTMDGGAHYTILEQHPDFALDDDSLKARWVKSLVSANISALRAMISVQD